MTEWLTLSLSIYSYYKILVYIPHVVQQILIAYPIPNNLYLPLTHHCSVPPFLALSTGNHYFALCICESAFFVVYAAAAAAASLQSCPTLCDPIDGSPPGSPVPGILQARTLEWVAISFSSAWKWKVKVKSLSRVRLYRPRGLQPTRLLCPWDFPSKSTGVGCHFLLQCMKVKSESEVAQSCPTLATPWTAAHQAALSMGFSKARVLEWGAITFSVYSPSLLYFLDPHISYIIQYLPFSVSLIHLA